VSAQDKKGEVMANLLKETLEDIKDSGHEIQDIVFIGSQGTGHRCTWDEFRVLADKEYDSSYGAAKVAQDLVVVFSDGQQLRRGEYDGSEWWEYSKPFEEPKASKEIASVFVSDEDIGWKSLAQINKED
jgi:hypothetical protein